jgi:hypothetical protein
MENRASGRDAFGWMRRSKVPALDSSAFAHHDDPARPIRSSRIEMRVHLNTRRCRIATAPSETTPHADAPNENGEAPMTVASPYSAPDRAV